MTRRTETAAFGILVVSYNYCMFYVSFMLNHYAFLNCSTVTHIECLRRDISLSSETCNGISVAMGGEGVQLGQLSPTVPGLDPAILSLA